MTQFIYVTKSPSPCGILSPHLLLLFSLTVSGGRSDVSLSFYEALRGGRNVSPPPCTLPPPPVRKQRLQWPVSPPRVLLAPAKARAQHLWGLQWHLHPAQSNAPGAIQKQPSVRPGQPALWFFFCRELPNAATVCWIPVHAHPAQVALLTSPRPGPSYGYASITCATPSLSHTHAHERLPLLERVLGREGETVTPHHHKCCTFRCGWEQILSLDQRLMWSIDHMTCSGGRRDQINVALEQYK